MTLLTKRFQQWARKNKKFSSKGSDSRGSGSKNKKEEQNRTDASILQENWSLHC
jgi:hypothetical protein